MIHPEVRTYFRDVNDHLLRAHEQLEGFRDLLTSVLSANLAQVTVRQNEDVRRISAIVAILAVPTMIAAIYGMNFEHMPELGWTFGYPLVARGDGADLLRRCTAISGASAGCESPGLGITHARRQEVAFFAAGLRAVLDRGLARRVTACSVPYGFAAGGFAAMLQFRISSPSTARR